MRIKSYLAVCVLALVVSFGSVAGAGDSVVIPIPREVNEALGEVGIRMETTGTRNEKFTQAAIIGGGLIVAGVIIALAIRRKRA